MKYIGSKKQLAEYICPILQSNMKRYYVEPFCGICSIGQHIIAERKIFNDSNPYLIEFYKALIKGTIIPNGSEYIDKETYTEIYHNRAQLPPALVGYVLLKANRRGKFSAWSDRATDQAWACKEMFEFKQRHKEADFLCMDYRVIKLPSPEETLIYCDPPYRNTQKYEFTFDHRAFWHWASNLVRSGYTVYVSEASLPQKSVTSVNWSTVWSKEIKSNVSAGVSENMRTEYLFKGVI